MSATPLAVVLVVEDDVFVRSCTGEALRETGFGVMEACDAQEAMELLKLHPEVDILFSDINMPGTMDGLGLARWVHEANPKVLMILTSGRGSPAEKLPGDTRFVQKPYSTGAVAQLMTEMIGRR